MCPSCGADFDPANAEEVVSVGQQPEAEVPEASSVRCPNCEALITYVELAAQDQEQRAVEG